MGRHFLGMEGNLQAILRNMLRAAFDDMTNPIQTLDAMLAPYTLSKKDALSIVETIVWSKAYLTKKGGHHPLSDVLKDIQAWKGEKATRNDDDDDDEIHKAKFLYMATAIPHVWCRNVKPVALIDLNGCDFCAFEGPNRPVPWVWFNVNAHQGLDVVEYNARIPWIKLEVERTTKMGPLQTLELEYFKPETQKGVSVPSAAASKLVVSIDETCFLVSVQSEMDYEGPLDVEMPNYMILFTEGSLMRLSIVYLVNPRTHAVIEYPISVHLV